MSGSACGSHCGWCGACSSAWEGPMEFVVACEQCGKDFYVEADEQPPFRCPRCVEQNVIADEAAREKQSA